MSNKIEYKVAFPCVNAAGEPDFVLIKVMATSEEIESRDAFDEACLKAKEGGFDSIAFDHFYESDDIEMLERAISFLKG